MANIRIDFNKTVGRVKPQHGIGQPPMLGRNFEHFHYLTEAGIPYSRLHDVGGAFGGFRWVDIPNIFRDFDADENDPDSYDFAFTDLLITALMEAGCEPYFRLGVTIENDSVIKAYRIFPPKDYAKWARICEHVIRHYTEGWADGFRYDIKYWEIWNEPDSKPDPKESMMWMAEPEEYFKLYDVASKHLKSCFPHLKIGGYAACGFYGTNPEKLATKDRERFIHYVSFFERFLEHISKSGAPLDYFSWHCYDSSVKRLEGYCKYVREMLDKYGYTETESSCNEWSVDSGKRGTFLHAAKTAAALIAFQHNSVDNAMIYDARVGAGRYACVFNADGRPHPTYYALTAFNRLYELENEVECTTDSEDIYVMAAAKDGKGVLVIANPTEEEHPIEISANGERIITLLTSDGMRTDRAGLDSLDPRCDGAVCAESVIKPYSIITVIYNVK